MLSLWQTRAECIHHHPSQPIIQTSHVEVMHTQVTVCIHTWSSLMIWPCQLPGSIQKQIIRSVSFKNLRIPANFLCKAFRIRHGSLSPRPFDSIRIGHAIELKLECHRSVRVFAFEPRSWTKRWQVHLNRVHAFLNYNSTFPCSDLTGIFYLFF